MWAQRAWRVGLPSGMGRSKLENAAGVGQVCSQRIIKRTGGSGPPNKGACHALLAPALSGSSPFSRELAGLVRQRLRSHFLPTAFFFVCLAACSPKPHHLAFMFQVWQAAGTHAAKGTTRPAAAIVQNMQATEPPAELHGAGGLVSSKLRLRRHGGGGGGGLGHGGLDRGGGVSAVAAASALDALLPYFAA